MTSYRLYFWSADEARLHEERMDIADRDGASLLDRFARIGRRAVLRDGDAARAVHAAGIATPSRARARRHLRIARRLLEDLGEYVSARRTAMSLADLRRPR